MSDLLWCIVDQIFTNEHYFVAIWTALKNIGNEQRKAEHNEYNNVNENERQKYTMYFIL